MEKAREILQRILQRKLYQHLGTYKIPLKTEVDKENYKKIVSKS